MRLCGAENETRTRDPNLGKVVLYQLSYFRIMSCHLSDGIAKVRLFFYSANLFVIFVQIFIHEASRACTARSLHDFITFCRNITPRIDTCAAQE